MVDHIDIPADACRIRLADDDLEVAEPTEEGRKPRFRMRVNSGIPMSHAYFGTLAVNLSGIEVQHRHVPALLDHDPQRRVGYTTKLYVDDDEGLVAEGVMLSNDYAQQVRQDSLDGFPFQASCYLVADHVTQVPEGEQLSVNGHDVVGPATVFDASNLREVTFTALGQDPNTSSDATLTDGGSTVRATLSVFTGSKMNNEQDETTPMPEPVAVVDQDAVRLEAQRVESERVSFILECAADSQISLARQLIKEGASTNEAALTLARDMRERDQQRAPATVAQPVVAPLAAAQGSVEDGELIASMPEGEDKWERQWSGDVRLRDEFGGNKNVWLAFNRNKHKCADFGSRREFHNEGGSK